MKEKPSKNVTLIKDIDAALNNACASVLNGQVMKGTPDARKRKLRAYLSGMIDAILEHRKSGDVTAEELVFVLVAGALFIQKLLVSKNKRSPVYDDIAKDMVIDWGQDD
jgi:hypothetical protein